MSTFSSSLILISEKRASNSGLDGFGSFAIVAAVDNFLRLLSTWRDIASPFLIKSSREILVSVGRLPVLSFAEVSFLLLSIASLPVIAVPAFRDENKITDGQPGVVDLEIGKMLAQIWL